MTRFDAHVIARILRTYLFLVGALVLFFIVFHYLEYVDDFMDRGASMREVFALYYPNYIPEIVRLTSPLAIFLACVYVTGKLAQELQIVALQTSGVSLYRLLLPYALVGLVLTGFMFWFNGWIVPTTNETVTAYDQRYLSGGADRIDVSNIHRQTSPTSSLSVGYYDAESRTAHRVALQQTDSTGHVIRRLDAPRMTWQDSTDSWRIHDAILRHFDGSRSSMQEVAARDTVLTVLPRDLARTSQDVAALTLPEARQYIDALRRTGANEMGRTLVTYYARWAYPFANLILILIGMPLAATRRRGGQAARIGLGLAVAFSYLAAQKVSEPFGYAGTLAPSMAAWMPHVLFAGAALLVLIRARK